MRQFLFLMLALLPLVGFGQGSGGISVAGMSNTLEGHFTETSGPFGAHVGIWGEYKASSWFGLHSSIQYAMKGGRVGDIEVNQDYLTLSITPRFHVSDGDESAEFIFGIGGYTNLSKVGSDVAGFGDIGIALQSGVAWHRIAGLIFIQRGFVDILPDLPKKQWWVSVGVGVEINLLRHRPKS